MVVTLCGVLKSAKEVGLVGLVSNEMVVVSLKVVFNVMKVVEVWSTVESKVVASVVVAEEPVPIVVVPVSVPADDDNVKPLGIVIVVVVVSVVEPPLVVSTISVVAVVAPLAGVTVVVGSSVTTDSVSLGCVVAIVNSELVVVWLTSGPRG